MKYRILYIDILNVLACFGVVVMHSSGEMFSFSPSKTWWIATILQALTHFAIPMFFMIAGATLLDYRKRYTTAEYFKNRFKRIAIPFLVWTILYALWNQYYMGAHFDWNVISVANLFLNNEATNIFWYFYAAFTIYLIIPILSLIDFEKHRKALLYLLVILFCYNQILPIIRTFTPLRITGFLDFPLSSRSYIDYVLLGYFLKDLKITGKVKMVSIISFLIGIIGMVWGTYSLSFAGDLNPFLMDYHSIFVYMSAFPVFVLVKANAEMPVLEKARMFFQKVSSLSLGVYLIHIMVITVLSRVVHFPHPVLNMAGSIVVGYGGSLVLVWILRKIPLIQKIV